MFHPVRITLTLLVLCASSLLLPAQSMSFRPVWQDNIPVGDANDLFAAAEAPWFEGAELDPVLRNLPVRDYLIPVAADEELSLANVQLGEVTESSRSEFRTTARQPGKSGWYPAQAVMLGTREIRRGQHFQHVRVHPLQVEWQTGRVRTHSQLSWELQRIPRAHTPATTSSAKTYANNSILAAGTWLKIAVTSGGIYKLTASDLSNYGINPAQVDPRSLRLYGNGGHELPQEAGLAPDDLQENAIWVSGEADGTFDNGDFLLFYGESPHRWQYDAGFDRWTHLNNAYSDTTYYFLTYNQGNGKRIQAAPDPGPATFSPTYTDQFRAYEKDELNPLQSGRYWLGERFDLTPELDFEIASPGIRANSTARLSLRLAARSQQNSSFTIREGNNVVGQANVGAVRFEGYGNWYGVANETFAVPAAWLSDGAANLSLAYSKPTTSSVGYLDFMELEWEQTLFVGSRDLWFFRARENTGPGQVFGYAISGDRNHRYWDLSDPMNVRELNGPNFTIAADSIRQMVAFVDAGTRSPVRISRLPNQNLHALEPVEYLIIAPRSLFGQANRLADFHRQRYNRSVQIVDVREITTEFGSGQASPVAIRDFLKMVYDRSLDNPAGPQLQYVLLFGDGSYDHRSLVEPQAANLIPTYQARNSQHALNSYISDDFYTFLDDGEGFWGESIWSGRSDFLYRMTGDTLLQAHGSDIAIGRLPAENTEEATLLVDKIIAYKTDPDGFGAWRQKVVLVADHLDAEGSLHVSQANSYAPLIARANPCIQVEKLYLDNYQMEASASANFFPEGKAALRRQLDQGALIVNYTGHGGETGWSNSSILTISDINQLENGSRLPAFVTATCEFGRWDDPGRRSGAEQLVLNPQGGAIAMLTTVRVVESGSNRVINDNFYEEAFEWNTAENRWPTLGEVFRNTKNKSWLGGGINNRNFSLLGDPALPLNYPELNVSITHINGQAVDGSQLDSLPSLTRASLRGEVRSASGQLMDQFNGDLSIVIYDKPSTFTTRRSPFTFTWQKNRVFNGKTSVRQGRFEVEFVVPLDVSYEDGKGKISLYVENGKEDGGGCYGEIYPGGASPLAISDETPPELDIYLNDDKFVDGGMVGPDPLLIAEVYDENGLNTAGSGIGHDLTATLDGRQDKVIVLNEFYQARQDSYQEGEIRYDFSELEEGPHELAVKVWDVANNSAEAVTTFVVADNAQIALGHVLNYPNPFTTRTQFFIEHNLNGRPLRVQVKIFTVSGRLVKTLEDSFFSDGNLYCDMEWDGLDEYGDALGRGVYVYQVQLRDESTGEGISRFEKMVVLR